METDFFWCSWTERDNKSMDLGHLLVFSACGLYKRIPFTLASNPLQIANVFENSIIPLLLVQRCVHKSCLEPLLLKAIEQNALTEGFLTQGMSMDWTAARLQVIYAEDHITK